MATETRKRINLMWRPADWELLQRVRTKLETESDSETLRRALQVTEAVVDGKAVIKGAEVKLPYE